MTIIPLAVINCTVVEQFLQVFAFVCVSYGEQQCHCITTPIILSIENHVIPLKLVQMIIKAMVVPNLSLSMLLSQHADTMISMY
jgi:hypothetical protein